MSLRTSILLKKFHSCSSISMHFVSKKDEFSSNDINLIYSYSRYICVCFLDSSIDFVTRRKFKIIHNDLVLIFFVLSADLFTTFSGERFGFEPWPGHSHGTSPPRSINGYRRIVGET